MDLKGKDDGITPVTLEASVNHESVPPDNSEALCDFCNSIDFGRAGFYKSGFDTEITFNEFRPLCEVLQSSETCFFCRKVAKFCDEWSRGKFDKKAADLQGERNEIDYAIEPINLQDGDVDEPMGRLVRLKVGFTISEPSPEGRVYGPELQFQKCSQHPPEVADFCKEGSQLDWECGEEQAYSGRIRPLDANTRLFCKWKETCCKIHGAHCNSIFKSGRRPPRLRLIDVDERCVVDSEVGISYAALSYVWGKGNFFLLKKSTEALFRQAKSLISEVLPSTIDDAIVVAKSLGEKYIWVDSLCIIQDDEADQQEFIPIMDSIYGCASVTIIAASGDNANAGLPGIRPNSRTRIQNPFTIKGVSLLQTLDPEGSGDVSSYLGDSVWYRRGWTFQERIFSKRALIFAPEQVYWECQSSTWCEDGLWETMESPTVYRHCFCEKDFCRPCPLKVDSFERIYRKLVEEYSRRMLSDESDGLNAFAGILNALEGILNALETEAGQRFLWALPTSFLSNALTWRCSRGSYKRRIEKCTVSVKKEGGSSDGTITHCSFPSWSWVGWKGDICIGTSHGRLNAQSVDIIFYYVDAGSGLLTLVSATGATQSLSEILVREDYDRTTVTREDIPERVLARSIASNILFFWSSTAILRVGHGVGSSSSDKLILSHNGNDVPAKFWFHTPGPEDLGELEFVVIGKFTEYRELAELVMTRKAIEIDERLLAVLLVRWEDGVAYRKGLVHIYHWDWVALDNREWKLVCLA